MAVKFDNETVHYRSDGTYLYTTEQEIEALRANVVTTTGAQTVEFGDGTVTAPSITNSGDTNTGFWFPAADTIAASTGGSERMRIDSSGYVGIGKTPTTTLDVAGDINCGQYIKTGTGYSTQGIAIELGSARTGSGPCFIDLHAQSGTDYEARVIRDSGANGVLEIVNAGTGNLNFYTNSVLRTTIAGSNGVITSQPSYDNTVAGSTLTVTSSGVIGRTSSSLKYKKDIEDLDSALSDAAIANLRPVWYRTKTPTGDDKSTWSHIGLIAEEVALVEPRLVCYRTVDVTNVDVPVLDQDGNPELDENGNPKTRKERVETPLATPEPEDVNYARLSVILLDVVQRMKADLSALRSDFDAYKAAHP